MTKVFIVVMQYDSTKNRWSAYTCFDELINAEMTASSFCYVGERYFLEKRKGI